MIFSVEISGTLPICIYMRQKFCHIISTELNLIEEERYSLVYDLIKYICFLWLYCLPLFRELSKGVAAILGILQHIIMENIKKIFSIVWHCGAFWLFSLGHLLPLLCNRSVKIHEQGA